MPQGKIHTDIILLTIFLLLYFKPLILSGILERTFYVLCSQCYQKIPKINQGPAPTVGMCAWRNNVLNEKHISATLNRKHENVFSPFAPWLADFIAFKTFKKNNSTQPKGGFCGVESSICLHQIKSGKIYCAELPYMPTPTPLPLFFFLGLISTAVLILHKEQQQKLILNSD